jgi:hypothetical protein
MTTSNLAGAYGHLLTARLLIEAEIHNHGETYALADALSLTEDATSQLRGEMAAREPERPILDGEAA